MKPLLTACLMMATTLGTGAAQAQTPAAFDGSWAVTLVCAKTAGDAAGYTFRFVAQVANGVLHGEHGITGKEGWMTLDGTIQANGDARFSAHGLTGKPQTTVGHVSPLTPFRFHAAGHFDRVRGSGQRVELRPCTLAFEKM